MKSLFVGLLASLFLLGPAWGDGPPPAPKAEAAPRHLTVTRLSYGTVYCDESCSYLSPRPGRYSVNTPTGLVSVSVADPWVMIQSPQHVARVRQKETPQGQEILVQLDLRSYKIYRKHGEVQWQFPDDRVYFQMPDGNLRDVVGQQGSLTIRRNFRKNTYEVTSEAGTSQYAVKVGGGKKHPVGVQTLEGDPPSKHLYLVKGVTFQNGSVGIFIPLQGGKLLSALDAGAVRQVTFSDGAAAPGEYVIDNTPSVPVNEHPLQAAPPIRGILNAAPNEPGKDPLNLDVRKNQLPDKNADPIGTKLKKNPDVDHNDPLKANIPRPIRGAEDPLKVREFDPLAPSSAP